MRARLLRPGFFTNEDLAHLPVRARLLFAGLWCLADREGRLEDRPQRIKAAIFPYERVRLEPLIAALMRAGFVKRYTAAYTRCLALPTFATHQQPHHREPPSLLPPPPPQPGKAAARLGQSPTDPVLRSGKDPDPDQDRGGVASSAPVWSHRQHGAPLIGNHAGCFDAPAACARGLCVPLKLGLQWRQQRVSEAAIRAFVEATLATVPEGPIGDDPFTFWRAAWSAKHGSRAPVKATLPTGRQRAADVTIATLRRGSQ